MNASFYTSVIILGCFACFIMVVATLGNVTLPKEKRDLFLSIFVSVAAGSLFEWGAKMLDGIGGAASFAIVVLKLCEFILSPSIAVLYAAVFSQSMHDKHLVYAYKALAVHAAMELVLAPFGPATSDIEDVKRHADAKTCEVKRVKKVGPLGPAKGAVPNAGYASSTAASRQAWPVALVSCSTQLACASDWSM